MAERKLYRTGDEVHDFADPSKPKLVATWMKGSWYRLTRGRVAMEYDVVEEPELWNELAKAPRIG